MPAQAHLLQASEVRRNGQKRADFQWDIGVPHPFAAFAKGVGEEGFASPKGETD
jgi:hypothetical protein